MTSTEENPFLSPSGEQPAAKESGVHPATSPWQITSVLVLTYLFSAVCLLLSVLLFSEGFHMRNSDIIYFDTLVFKGPEEVRSFVYGLFAVSVGMVILAGLTFIAAIGLQTRRKWGRRLAMGLALLPLLPICFVSTRYAFALIPWGVYSVIVLLVLVQQKNRLQFQNGQAYADE